MKISSKVYQITATIDRVIDGDTVDATVDALFGMKLQITLRLYGINTPELHTGTPEQRLAGKAAADALRQLVEGQKLTIISYKEKEKYGRYLAEIVLPDGTTANEYLVKNGFAKKYFGGSR